MPKVKLDIAGMYFHYEVDVDAGATVKDVMDAVQTATANGATTGTPTFSYATEPYFGGPGSTINTITICHRNGSAESRQDRKRVYPDGIYSFTDDMVMVENNRLRAANPNLSAVHAWQYYVYDANGTEQARGVRNTSRTVVPFDRPSVDGGYEVGELTTIVWRLVTIFTRPTHNSMDEIADREITARIRVY